MVVVVVVVVVGCFTTARLVRRLSICLASLILFVVNGPEVVRHTHHVALWPYLRHDPSDIAAAMTVGIMGLIFSGHGNKDGM